MIAATTAPKIPQTTSAVCQSIHFIKVNMVAGANAAPRYPAKV